MTKTCHECGQLNATAAQFCQTCGTRLFTVNPLAATQPIDVSAAQAVVVEPAIPAANPAATQALTMPTLPGLPVGSLLLDRRLVIREIVQANANGLCFYVAEDRENMVCPICLRPTGAPIPDACPACGTVLAPEEWRPQRVLVKESLDPTALAGERAIAKADIRHDGLVNILGAFEHLPHKGAEPHSYLVAELDNGLPVTGLALPQPEASAVVWTLQLAEALAALHGQGFVHGRVQAANVTITADRARLTNFNRSSAIPDEPGAAKQALQADIDGVVGVLAALVGNLEVSDLTGRLTRQGQRPETDPTNPAAAATALAKHLESAFAAIRHPREVMLSVAGRSDVGQVRPLNEDTIAFVSFVHAHQSNAVHYGAAVVADGMGGHASGEVASGKAVGAFLQVAASGWPISSPDGSPTEPAAVLQSAVATAAAQVHSERQRTGSDLGTTLVGALWRGNTVHLAHCGDSRAYLLPADGELRALTKDHSLVRELVEAGQLDPADAETYEGRNFVTRALGGQAEPGFEFASPLVMAPGDRVLLCSDGLTGKVDDASIARMVRAAATLLAACDALIAAANAAGGEDNISIVILAAEAAGGA